MLKPIDAVQASGPGCSKHRLEPAFPGAGVIWVGTSPDSVAKIKESSFKDREF